MYFFVDGQGLEAYLDMVAQEKDSLRRLEDSLWEVRLQAPEADAQIGNLLGDMDRLMFCQQKKKAMVADVLNEVDYASRRIESTMEDLRRSIGKLKKR